MTEAAHRAQDCDDAARIIDALHSARSQRRPVYITAGGSKRDLIGRACTAVPLDVSAHRGILDYQPGELVITARAGTPLVDIASALAEYRQWLPFEPPLFAGRATLGGTLACNLNGPGRPWGGSIRDAVLGVHLISSRGERLRFGGNVMKNVAGFDVSRLQAGALGTLGVLDDITLKVLPQPQATQTLRYDLPADDAIRHMNQRAGESAPLSAAMWVDGSLFLRLSGAQHAVEHTVRRWGGERLPDDNTLWRDLREMRLPFFQGNAPLWRLSMQSTAPQDAQLGPALVDWCGAQRWVRGAHTLNALQRSAGAGHASLFRGGDRSGEVRAPLAAAEQTLHQRLKHNFDPDGILNPGRLYSWL